MIGPCAKARVKCTIVTEEGYRFVGENACRNPQHVCPREPGEDYTKCRLICEQDGHAEIMALAKAREWAVGATAYVEFKRVCDACAYALTKAGVRHVVLGPPPE